MALEFLKKHYEKLILLLLLVVFILVMIHMMGIVARTREIKDDDLEIPQRQPDYKVHDPESDDFKIARYIEKSGIMWQAAKVRDTKNGEHYSDLVRFSVDSHDKIWALAKCPFCKKVIPLSYFNSQKCPECGNEGHEKDAPLLLPPPEGERRVRKVSANDSDGDGIPNAVEQKFGLDPNNPEDANYDLDGDGFSNIYEYDNGSQGGADINDPAKHPPYWHRLRLVGFDMVELDVSFMALNTQNSTKPEDWDIQLNRDTGRRDKKGNPILNTEMVRLGDEIEVDKRRYKLVEIKHNVIEVPVGARKRGEGEADKKEIDQSEIYFEQVVEPDENGKMPTPDRLEMKVGKKSYSSDKGAIFIDDGYPTGRKLPPLRVGEVVTIANTAGNIRGKNTSVKYIVSAIDQKNHTATLRVQKPKDGVDPTLDETGKIMLVTEKGGIPESDRVIEGQSKGAGVGNPEMMMDPLMR